MGGIIVLLVIVLFFGSIAAMAMWGDDVLPYLERKRKQKAQIQLEIEREKTEQLRLQQKMIRDFQPPKDDN